MGLGHPSGHTEDAQHPTRSSISDLRRNTSAAKLDAPASKVAHERAAHPNDPRHDSARVIPLAHEAYPTGDVHARRYRRAAEQLSAADVQAHLAHLFQARKRSWTTCAKAAHVSRFLYHVTRRREKRRSTSPRPSSRRSCPTPGAGRKVWRLRAPLASALAGDHLRRRPSGVSEVVALKVTTSTPTP